MILLQAAGLPAAWRVESDRPVRFREAVVRGHDGSERLRAIPGKCRDGRPARREHGNEQGRRGGSRHSLNHYKCFAGAPVAMRFGIDHIVFGVPASLAPLVESPALRRAEAPADRRGLGTALWMESAFRV
jgi:hypothetical protein